MSKTCKSTEAKMNVQWLEADIIDSLNFLADTLPYLEIGVTSGP